MNFIEKNSFLIVTNTSNVNNNYTWVRKSFEFEFCNGKNLITNQSYYS